MPPVETLYHGIDQASIAAWARRNGVREELGHRRRRAGRRHGRELQVAQAAGPADPRGGTSCGSGSRTSGSSWSARDRSKTNCVAWRTTWAWTRPSCSPGSARTRRACARRFDVFALSSEHEGLSIALIEALALGKPAVVTRCRRSPRGDRGRPSRDSSSRSADTRRSRTASSGCSQDPALRARMGREGRTRADDFDIRHSVRRMEEVYEELLAMSRSRTGVDIRPYVDADERGRVIELLNVALGCGSCRVRVPRQFFRWKHLENPFGRSFMLVAETDGRIVGLRAFMRWEFEARRPALPGGARRRHGDASGLPGARDLLAAHAGGARRAPGRGRLRLQHPEREEPARVPEDGVAGRRPRADPRPRAAPDPVRGATPFVAHGGGARHRADRRRAVLLRTCSADGARRLARRSGSGRGASRPRGIAAYLRWRYGAAPVARLPGGRERSIAIDVDGLAIFRVRHAGRSSRPPSPRRIVRGGSARRPAGSFDGWRPSAPHRPPRVQLPAPSPPDAAARAAGFLRVPGGMTLVVNTLGHDLDPDPLDLALVGPVARRPGGLLMEVVRPRGCAAHVSPPCSSWWVSP